MNPLPRVRFASSTARRAIKVAPAPRPYKPSTPKPSKNTEPSHETQKHEETLLTLWRRSWLPLSGAALLAGALGFYLLGTTAASLKKPCCGVCEHTPPTGRPPALTGSNAGRFDRELDIPEWWMGVTRLRKKLAAEAKGHVLEVAVGSGRNLAHYAWDRVSSLTGVDISPDMLGVSRTKLAHVPEGRVRLVSSDAQEPLPPAGGDGYYDTVTQTFGLCSVSDPVGVLCNLAAAVRPGTGRIILLEHGKGWSGIVNGLLDRNADKHFAKYGCWWNRDIQALVEEAAERCPGLQVVKVERPNITQMGTLVWAELRVAATTPKTRP